MNYPDDEIPRKSIETTWKFLGEEVPFRLSQIDGMLLRKFSINHNSCLFSK